MGGVKMKTLFTNLLLLFFLSSLSNAQWYPQYSGVYSNLYSNFFLDEKNGWICGGDGVILKTTNGGFSWIQKYSGTSYSLSFIWFFNYNDGIVIGSGGTIKKTTNGGENWFSVSSGTYLRLLEGSFINDQQGWVCGDNGLVIKTTDGGNTWTTINYVTADNLSYIQFIDEHTGWVTTELNGEIWKTTDGGNTWSFKYQSPLNWDLRKLQFVNDTEGWAVGEWGLVVKSTDGGESWFQTNTITGEGMFGIYFYDSDHGFVVGKDENIIRSTNGGLNWIVDRVGQAYEFYNVFFVDNNRGWIIGSSGAILFTNNWGGFPFETSPIQISAPAGGEILTADSTFFIEWTSQNVLDVKIQYSTNNGTNWITIVDSIPSVGIYNWTIPNTLTIDGKVKISDITDPTVFDVSNGSFTIRSSKEIIVLDPNGGEIIEGGSQYEILWSSNDVENVKIEYSINNGASWNTIIDSTASSGIYLWTVPTVLTTQARIRISDISLPLVSDISDGSFRINYIVDVEEVFQVTEFNLMQNYPNPFNPATTIRYSIPETQLVTLTVYNSLGEAIINLVNEIKEAGNYEIEFDGTNLPSGIYLYTLSAGNFMQTKKLILLK